ncbi:CoA-acylating methylmalonate-semialdehyde dehydrogenase [Thermoactinomyces sp. CICC 10521]|uniref:CoA-acylating methylmalonate-semialdehyde dehydrogenase n=1 Tax=Thermoactinomyces sp. CICC 10521 TaxID=2767426 RepID=UPI0018DC2A24|nr:CoA-acylating methylmalonate-semialdehyde dehydrogenase [Thermoactinomyces sp. CICC 10521]MBH8608245.1 CoA-acylating methylmalonate-semialdehyde dehydrogenase [Thermoactinomyces sp. CICC 10521]
MSMIVKGDRLPSFVGGKWCTSNTRDVLPVPNPATEEVLALVPLSGTAEVDAAVRSAQEAFLAWRETPVTERVRILLKFRELLVQHLDTLSRTLTEENGKTLNEAKAEIWRGIEVVEFAAGMPSLMKGEVTPQVSRGIDMEMVRDPVGVVAGITPFNFPVMVPLWMVPLALAAGNTFVLKPSERTPLSAVRLVELAVEAGLPEGVFNLVHGGKEAVDALLCHPGVDAVSFVGSQPVAEHVYKTAAAHGKRVQALAGAKNCHIVHEDANMEGAVQSITGSAFGCAGQRCMAGSVVVVLESVADRFLKDLVAAAERVRVGNGLEEGTEQGPLIRDEHRKKVLERIEQGLKEGAVMLRDGRNLVDQMDRGFFLGPTILDRVRPEMTVFREELFAPVLSVIRVKDLDEAIRVVNRSRFGNAAVLYTESGKAARRFRERVQAGMLGINVGVPVPAAFYPFSGWKQSFYGDLHANGKDAVEFYTRKKVVTSRWFG